MPLIIPQDLPSYEILNIESLLLLDEKKYKKKILHPIKILILNLMPTKLETETQLLRVLGNSDFQVEITFLIPKTYIPKNTCKNHLNRFYKTFHEIKEKQYDGLIITGAPVEHLDFEAVDYWEELKEIMDYGERNVNSTFYICWGAQAALYYHYGINKYLLDKKVFGVFPHKINRKNAKLVQGFDDFFFAPHSRHTGIKKEDIEKNKDLQIIAESDEAGIYMVQSKDLRKIFVTGHSEYDAFTLQKEYERDKDENIEIDIPKHYFLNDDPKNKPTVSWRSHGNLLFSNWLKIINELK